MCSSDLRPRRPPPTLAERFGPDALEPASDDRVVQWAWRLKTQAGRALYAKHKATVEPVFGIVKQAMGFRQFSLRDLAAVAGEWTLVTLAFNLNRMHVLRLALGDIPPEKPLSNAPSRVPERPPGVAKARGASPQRT